MRENRTHGSEGGVGERSSLPLSLLLGRRQFLSDPDLRRSNRLGIAASVYCAFGILPIQTPEGPCNCC